jgi:GcrA cell cycle regulator
MSKGWDSGMLKKLKSLVGKGLSTAEIGKKIGMSKNAVVGKLNRLGWNSKAGEVETQKATKTKKETTKVATKKTEKPAKATSTKKVAEKKTKVVAPKNKETKPVKTKVEKSVKEKITVKTASKKTKKDLALHELLIQHALQMASLKPNQCRWPIGDPDSDNFHFCGETVFSGKPYCYEHCRQAYQLTPPKKK